MQKILKEVSEVIGFPLAIELCRKWGGLSLRIPKKIKVEHPIAVTIGLEYAAKLSQIFGGENIYLPLYKNSRLAIRNAEIYKACIEEGKSRTQVGAEFGITRQSVSAIIKKIEEDKHYADYVKNLLNSLDKNDYLKLLKSCRF